MPDTLTHGTAASNDSLAQLPFFRGASPETLARITAAVRWFSVEADQIVFDYGDDSTDIFFVVRGALRVFIRTALGQEMILDDLGNGEIFGDIAAIDEARRLA